MKLIGTLQFPRGGNTLTLRIYDSSIVAALRANGGDVPAQVFYVAASIAACWRFRSTVPNDPLPENLYIDRADIGLTAAEAGQLDDLLRIAAPNCLRHILEGAAA